ncbi:MAG TPA: hypothetical protein PK777_07195 [Thermoguttaceae bacterium]|nr:hypothetical protein [Thermoguttaceae bacterium]HPP52716.1 hypothetical protein [Thermoguttaceae bacterium]
MSPLIQHPTTWLRIPSLPPGWDGLHPWMVHCPMALFLTAPVFVLLAMILFNRGRWMSLTALILLGLGLIGASFSQSSGLAARDYLDQSSVKLSDEAADVLQRHQQLGSMIVPVYGILFVVYLVLFLLSIAVRPFDNPVWLFFMNLIFLVLLAVAGLVLVNTGELGGRLVHEFGVHGRIRPMPPAAEKPKPPEEKPTPPPEKPKPPEEKPPVKEKPAPPEKPVPPQEKPTPPKEEPKPAEQKPTPSEKPEEKPGKPETAPPAEKAAEKSAQEKTTPPTEEKPAAKTEGKPSEQKPGPAEEKPTGKPEEKSPAKSPAPPAEEKPSTT